MDIERTVVINGMRIQLDYSLDCGTEFAIYLHLCEHCDHPRRDGLHLGQSVNCVRTRANGHRAAPTESLYKKSALAYHIWDKHREHFHQKLDNFRVGVIKSSSPGDLDRAEDFFVVATEADIKGLNRHKAMA
jgi:hypothetical protein